MLCKIWGFHGSDYEECGLLGYRNPVRTSQETHYVSTTESSQLMLCKIWCFHGSDYEEWRLQGYKTPVFTSQETHKLSTTDSSQLMLCKIWAFHGSDCKECRLLGCDAGSILMMKIRSCETSVLTRGTRSHIPEDGILQSLNCPKISFFWFSPYCLWRAGKPRCHVGTRRCWISTSGWELGAGSSRFLNLRPLSRLPAYFASYRPKANQTALCNACMYVHTEYITAAYVLSIKILTVLKLFVS
jgi:hypothetical protein